MPTTAVLPAANSCSAAMRSSKAAIFSSTSPSRPNMLAMAAALERTLSMTPLPSAEVSVWRNTTGAIWLRSSYMEERRPPMKMTSGSQPMTASRSASLMVPRAASSVFSAYWER